MTDESASGSERTKVLMAECPMSWCDEMAVVEDPETPYDAAYEISDHVNEDHSEDDLATLELEDYDV